MARPDARRLVVIAALVVASMAAPAPVPARAATVLAVNSAVDLPDANPGDGVCAASDGSCTLRAAVMEANALPGPDTIVLQANTTYTLTLHGPGENASAVGDLDITGADDLTIAGAGSRSSAIVGDATWDDRIIEISSTGSVSISGVTISGGHSPSGQFGGGMSAAATSLTLNDLVFSGNTSGADGGGLVIENGTTTTVNATGLTVFNNTAAGSGGGLWLGGALGAATLSQFNVKGNSAGASPGNGYGGGIIADSGWTIRNGTVSGNSTTLNGGGIVTGDHVTLEDVSVTDNAGLFGGGVQNGLGLLTMRRVTVAGNTATYPGGWGGGVNDQGAFIEMENVTISGNHGGGFATNSFSGHLTNVTIAGNDGGAGTSAGTLNFSGTHELRNVIVAGNSPANCAGTWTSGGNNLEDGTSCMAVPASDPSAAPVPFELHGDPLLGPLADNGGPTQTRALLPGSPAIDVVSSGVCPPPTTDQRGVARPQGSACDVGAYEFAPSADLSTTQTDDRDPIAVGEDVIYTVTVHNAGPSTASGVTMSDSLPAGSTFVSATPTASGTCTAGTGALTCVWAQVAANATAAPAVAIRVTANAAGTLTNTATVAATGGPTDPTPGNNQSIETTTVTGAKTADLALTKSGPATALAGDLGGFDYQLAVSNGGPFDETGFTITDTLPAAGTFVSASPGCVLGSGSVVCTGGALAIGAVSRFTIHMRVPASVPDAAVLTNQASVAGQLADPNGTNDAAQVTTTVAASADLALTKSLQKAVGAELTYELAVTTSGPSDGARVQVTDPLPAHTVFVSADHGGASDPTSGLVTWNLGTVPAAGPPVLLHLTIRVDPQWTTPVPNTACVTSGTQDPHPADNCSSLTTNVGADLRLDKTGPDVAVAGDPGGFDYQLAVANGGPLDEPGFTVSDAVPAGVSFVSASSGCSFLNGTVTCGGGRLAVGGTATFTIHIRVPTSVPDGTVILNQASVGGQIGDPNLANNQAEKKTTVAVRADLSLNKTGPDSVVAGTDLHYAVSVANAGPSDATGVAVSDQLPAGTTFVAADHGGTFDPQRGVVTWSLGDISSAAVPVQLHLTVHVAPDRTAALANIACASSVTHSNLPSCSSASTVVTTSADLAVTQTAPATVALGDAYPVTVTVTNNGPSTATGVVLTETLQAHLEFLPGQPCGPSLTVATCSLGTLGPGASQTVSFQVRGVLTCTITGTSGIDHLVGTAGPDIICGGAGDDTILGLGGNDYLYGYGPRQGETLTESAVVQAATPDPIPGNNTVTTATHIKGATEAGPDNDTIDGGPGNDFISGDYGSDTLNGGPGDDQIWGDIAGPASPRPPMFPDPTDPTFRQFPRPPNFSDPTCEQPGDFSKSPFDGSDTINGNSGNDEIHGQGGNDGGGKRKVGQGELEGGGGRDHICGGFGSDHLDGGPDQGNILNGGPGTDWCSRGPGRGDYFVSCQNERWWWNGRRR